MRIEDFAERPQAGSGRIQSRYRGVMLGLASGNALGLEVEGWTQGAITARYPMGLHDIDTAERRRPWDDDLAQAAILGDLLLLDDVLDPEAFAGRLIRWMQENGRGVGTLTHQVIVELASGVSPARAAEQVWERSGRTVAGNGAVMRCAPIALRWRSSGTHLVAAARTSALVTHHDPRCVWSTIAVVVALSFMLSGEDLDINELAAVLEASGADRECVEAVRETPGRKLDEFRLDDDAGGYTLRAMQVALWCTEQAEDFESVLTAVVNAGGDTDTNGAVAGAIMGARCGVEDIPRRWLASISGAGRLIGMADRLMAASISRRALFV